MIRVNVETRCSGVRSQLQRLNGELLEWQQRVDGWVRVWRPLGFIRPLGGKKEKGKIMQQMAATSRVALRGKSLCGTATEGLFS